MSVFASISRGSRLKAAKKRIEEARQTSGGKSGQLYKSAYEALAKVVQGDTTTADALHHWGFGLLHEARSLEGEEAKKIYIDAIDKFRFCLLMIPTHLGGAIDGGVAYMELARIAKVPANDQRYDLALEFFNKAENIQKGSASYNLACIYALRESKDQCLMALEQSREYGSLPDEQEVMADPDMAAFRDATWFQEFLGSVEVAKMELAENERRTRRGLREGVEEIKLEGLPPRPTDSTLKRHFDQMVKAELENLTGTKDREKREAEEARMHRRHRGDTFDYYAKDNN